MDDGEYICIKRSKDSKDAQSRVWSPSTDGAKYGCDFPENFYGAEDKFEIDVNNIQVFICHEDKGPIVFSDIQLRQLDINSKSISFKIKLTAKGLTPYNDEFVHFRIHLPYTRNGQPEIIKLKTDTRRVSKGRVDNKKNNNNLNNNNLTPSPRASHQMTTPMDLSPSLLDSNLSANQNNRVNDFFDDLSIPANNNGGVLGQFDSQLPTASNGITNYEPTASSGVQNLEHIQDTSPRIVNAVYFAPKNARELMITILTKMKFIEEIRSENIYLYSRDRTWHVLLVPYEDDSLARLPDFRRYLTYANEAVIGFWRENQSEDFILYESVIFGDNSRLMLDSMTLHNFKRFFDLMWEDSLMPDLFSNIRHEDQFRNYNSIPTLRVGAFSSKNNTLIEGHWLKFFARWISSYNVAYTGNIFFCFKFEYGIKISSEQAAAAMAVVKPFSLCGICANGCILVYAKCTRDKPWHILMKNQDIYEEAKRRRLRLCSIYEVFVEDIEISIARPDNAEFKESLLNMKQQMIENGTPYSKAARFAVAYPYERNFASLAGDSVHEFMQETLPCNEHGGTPLHIASFEHDLNAIKSMSAGYLEACCSVKDTYGNIPLDLAMSEDSELIRLLTPPELKKQETTIVSPFNCSELAKEIRLLIYYELDLESLLNLSKTSKKFYIDLKYSSTRQHGLDKSSALNEDIWRHIIKREYNVSYDLVLTILTPDKYPTWPKPRISPQQCAILLKNLEDKKILNGFDSHRRRTILFLVVDRLMPILAEFFTYSNYYNSITEFLENLKLILPKRDPILLNKLNRALDNIARSFDWEEESYHSNSEHGEGFNLPENYEKITQCEECERLMSVSVTLEDVEEDGEREMGHDMLISWQLYGKCHYCDTEVEDEESESVYMTGNTALDADYSTVKHKVYTIQLDLYSNEELISLSCINASEGHCYVFKLQDTLIIYDSSEKKYFGRIQAEIAQDHSGVTNCLVVVSHKDKDNTGYEELLDQLQLQFSNSHLVYEHATQDNGFICQSDLEQNNNRIIFKLDSMTVTCFIDSANASQSDHNPIIAIIEHGEWISVFAGEQSLSRVNSIINDHYAGRTIHVLQIPNQALSNESEISNTNLDPSAPQELLEGEISTNPNPKASILPKARNYVENTLTEGTFLSMIQRAAHQKQLVMAVADVCEDEPFSVCFTEPHLSQKQVHEISTKATLLVPKVQTSSIRIEL